MAGKILIVCPGHQSTFVQLDAALLSQLYPTEVLGFDQLPRPKIVTVPLAVFRKLRRENFGAVAMWFSVPHLAPLIVLLAKFFKKKIFVITGGYDIAYVPSIQWGEMQSWWKRIFQQFTLARVDRIFPFSSFSRSDVIKYAPNDKVCAVYLGIDTQRFVPCGEKENLVVTTCIEINYSTIIQKGLHTFVECARQLPEMKFLVIGRNAKNDSIAESFLSLAPQNVQFTRRYISNEELVSSYQRARVYVQVSAHEGFGIACAEAMACECVPVGTNNTSLPEVIGDTGFLVNFGDASAAVRAVREALQSPGLGRLARQRICANFSMECRSTALLSEVRRLMESQ